MITTLTSSRRGSGVPATAGKPLHVKVACYPSPDARSGAEHWVTLNPDWTVETPHDMAAERIAVALGGYCDCLTLAETAIPALQEWLELHLRERFPDVQFNRDAGWRVSRASNCDCPPGFRWVGEAADHATSAEHLAHKYGANPRHTVPLARALASHWQTTVEGAQVDPALSVRTRIPSAARSLWLAGIHPTWAWHYVNGIPTVRAPIPLTYFLGMAYTRPQPERRRELAQQRDGASAAWLVWSRECPEPRRPLAYAGWLGLSSMNADRATTMLTAGYDSTQADELSAGLHVPAHDAGRLLFEWVRLGCRPRLEDLLDLGPSVTPPPGDLLEMALGSTRVADADITRTQVALLLAFIERVEPVLDAVSDGVRTISDFRRWINDERDH